MELFVTPMSWLQTLKRGISFFYHTKLLDVSESLELWGVDDFHQQWMKLNVPMDGIIEHEQLCIHDQGVSKHLKQLSMNQGNNVLAVKCSLLK